MTSIRGLGSELLCLKGSVDEDHVYVELVRKLLSDDADVEEFAEMVLLVEPLSLRRQRPATEVRRRPLNLLANALYYRNITNLKFMETHGGR